MKEDEEGFLLLYIELLQKESFGSFSSQKWHRTKINERFIATKNTQYNLKNHKE